MAQLTPEAADQLVAQGVLSPETAAMLAQNQSPTMSTQDPSLQPQAPVEQPLSPAVQETPVKAGALAVDPNSPLARGVQAIAAQNFANAPAVEEAPAPGEILPTQGITSQIAQGYGNVANGQPAQAPQMPAEVPKTQAQIDQEKFDNAVALEQQAPTKADDSAANRSVAQERAVSDAVAGDAIKQDVMLQAANEIATQRAQQRMDRGSKTLQEIMRDGNFGDKLGAALAVLAGGVSQGLTGAATNPAIDAINKAIEQEAQRRKLNMEETKDLQHATAELAQLKLTQMQHASDSEYKKAQIENLKAEAAKHSAEAGKIIEVQEQQKAVQEMLRKGGKITSPEMLDEKQRERAVAMPDGSYQLATNPHAAQKLLEYKNQSEPALSGIQRIKQAVKDFNKFTDPVKRQSIATEVKALAGQLRLPFLGPGPMTEGEYNRLLGLIGDPTTFLSVPILQAAKLDAVEHKLKADYKQQHLNAGIKIPESRDEQILQKLINGGMSPEKAQRALDKIKGQ